MNQNILTKAKVWLGLYLLILSFRSYGIEVGETVILRDQGVRTVHSANADGSFNLKQKTGEVEQNIAPENIIQTTLELDGLVRASTVIWKPKGVVFIRAIGVDGTLVVEPDFGSGIEKTIPKAEYVQIVKILPATDSRPEMKTFHKIVTNRGEYVGASALGIDGTVVYHPVWNQPARVLSPDEYTPTIPYHPSGVRAFGQVQSKSHGLIQIENALPDGSAIFRPVYTDPVIIIKPDEMTPIIPPPDEKSSKAIDCPRSFSKVPQ